MSTADVLVLAETREALRSGTAAQLRREVRLSQAEIARAIGTAPSTVSRWEAGERLPKGRAARRYANLLAELERALSSNDGKAL